MIVPMFVLSVAVQYESIEPVMALTLTVGLFFSCSASSWAVSVFIASMWARQLRVLFSCVRVVAAVYGR
jgi:hypothetical protein